ncbi:helix-turn-helix transcriptional regulator [Facklamia sp. DSM 111018]|uniref:Helix-turn-helix transcriptional regulator n=1 Tax=Facklamia lactis TaxID=2749967 RepID=A0ABS0LSY6_9LACT|nr:helix-turn-helix transcriptional regulator [Facklamia lactis]MBG9986374.1 helix-turn-helix transcriptional regulator [Facklamia lactis]
MDEKLELKNNLKEIRRELQLTQEALSKMVGVSRNTISSIETGQYTPSAKLAYLLCLALEKTFEEIFYISTRDN